MEPQHKKFKLDNKPTCTPSLRDLPEELVDEILEYCKINDILKLSEVDKYWNSYIKTSQKWMKKITLTVTERNYKEIVNCTRQYQKVCMQSKPPLRSEALKKALQHQFESIRDIEMSVINLAGIRFPNLRKMYLNSVLEYACNKNLDRRDFYFTKPRRATKERFLEDVKCSFAYHSTQLEVLHLHSHLIEKFSVEMMALELLKNLKAFKTLMMDQQYEIVNKSIIALDLSYSSFKSLSTFPNLQYLHVKHLSLENIRMILTMPHMKRAEFACLYTGKYSLDTFDAMKHYSKKFLNIDLDKENKSNVKFVKVFTFLLATEADFFAKM